MSKILQAIQLTLYLFCSACNQKREFYFSHYDNNECRSYYACRFCGKLVAK